MSIDVEKDANERISKVFNSLSSEFSKIRSGRVSANLIDKLPVECYGSTTILSQLASISNPEARLLVISPWDKNTLHDIEKAIQKENIGVNPSNDGKVIRLVFPALSQERRQESIKLAKKIAENHKVAIRNIRRDLIDELKKEEKASVISENEMKQGEEKLQKIVDKGIDEISKILDNKSKEILEI